MGDNSEVLKSIDRKDGVWYPVLTPNIKVKWMRYDSHVLVRSAQYVCWFVAGL